MLESLAPGIELSRDYVVTDEMSPPHLPVKVLSTPSMVGMIEGTCMALVTPHLADGETSVGTHVCVSHEAAVTAGESITIWCRLSEVNKRRLTFETRVEGPRGLVSAGTHQRAVINPSRLG